MTEAHTARSHAKLAPSAAKRWVSCPGSIRMSEGIPNVSSVFAAEGTAAHELCSHCLETGDDPATFLEMWIDIEAADGKSRFVNLDEPPTGENRFFEVTEEMADAVAEYVNHVKSLMGDPDDTLVSIEEKLDMRHLHPECSGTGDATVLRINERHLHVCDFKYGKGVAVDVDDNPQLLLYAAGAARRHHNHQIAKLTSHVIQPRASHRDGGIRTSEIDLLDLFEFEADIRAAGQRVDEATAEYTPDDAGWRKAYLAAGEWCRFCPAQAICPTRREKALSDAGVEFGDVGDLIEMTAPDELSEEKLGAILREADSIQNYVKAVQTFAHDRACAGKTPKGFKLVEKRATRKWKDPEAAEEHLLVLGVSKDEMYEEPKFKTPAKLERYFPGSNKEKRQQAMKEAGLVKQESSGTNLVPESDPRLPVKADAASEFEAVDLG